MHKSLCVCCISIAISSYLSFSSQALTVQMEGGMIMLMDSGYEVVFGFVCIEAAGNSMFLFLWSHANHQVCALRRCSMLNLGMFVLNGWVIVKSTVSFFNATQHSVLFWVKDESVEEEWGCGTVQASAMNSNGWEYIHSLALFLSRFESWQQLALVIIVEVTLK